MAGDFPWHRITEMAGMAEGWSKEAGFDYMSVSVLLLKKRWHVYSSLAAWIQFQSVKGSRVFIARAKKRVEEYKLESGAPHSSRAGELVE